MSLDDILALSEEEFNEIYMERLYKLREDIKKIKARQKKKNKPLTKNQELISNMISGASNSVTITENNIRVKLSIGCRKHGLKHILLRHFCDECEGRIFAIDIISLERFFKKINKFNANNNKYGYNYEKDKDNKYRLLVFCDINSEGVISVFRMDRLTSEVKSGEGANSPEEKSSETSRVNLE